MKQHFIFFQIKPYAGEAASLSGHGGNQILRTNEWFPLHECSGGSYQFHPSSSNLFSVFLLPECAQPQHLTVCATRCHSVPTVNPTRSDWDLFVLSLHVVRLKVGNVSLQTTDMFPFP